MLASSRFAMGAWANRGGRLLAMARRTVRRSVQTTSRTDAFRRQPWRDGPCEFIHRLSRTAPVHLRHYFAEPRCGMALRFNPSLEQESTIHLCRLPLVWSSRSSEQETPSSLSRVFHPSLEQRLPSTYTPIRSPPISHPSCAHSMVTHRMQADRCMSFGRLSVHRFGNGVLPPDEQPA